MLTLVATLHDADRRLYDQTERMLPLVRSLYTSIVVLTTATTAPETSGLLREAGACVVAQPANAPVGLPLLGRGRREALALGLEAQNDWLHFCDWDRLIHWAEFYGDELTATVARIPEADCTVHGRTARAFQTHPRGQRETEAQANHIFALVSGQPWDVTAVSRGLARRAATIIVEQSSDDTVGTDASWPLLLLRNGTFGMTYTETEGLEFETADRLADQISAVGGYDTWLAALDRDPVQWTLRIELALLEARSALAFHMQE